MRDLEWKAGCAPWPMDGSAAAGALERAWRYTARLRDVDAGSLRGCAAVVVSEYEIERHPYLPGRSTEKSRTCVAHVVDVEHGGDLVGRAAQTLLGAGAVHRVARDGTRHTWSGVELEIDPERGLTWRVYATVYGMTAEEMDAVAERMQGTGKP